MLTISVKANVAQFKRDMDDLAKRKMPSIIALTLNETAFKAKDSVVAEMRRVFDRPTPWTLNSMRVRRAGPRNLTATVYFREEGGTPPSTYLFPEIYGGARIPKRFEDMLRSQCILPNGMFAVPGTGATLDRYGNMASGQVVQILSYFRAFYLAGSSQNITDKRKKRMGKATKKRVGVRYFVGTPGGAPLGVWQQLSQIGARKIKPILIFVRQPTYRRRLAFEAIVQRAVQRELGAQLTKAASAMAVEIK